MKASFQAIISSVSVPMLPGRTIDPAAVAHMRWMRSVRLVATTSLVTYPLAPGRLGNSDGTVTPMIEPSASAAPLETASISPA